MRRLFNWWKYGPLINKLERTAEIMRQQSYEKVRLRNLLLSDGYTNVADLLTSELLIESRIFYSYQRAISEFCLSNGLKDPFAI